MKPPIVVLGFIMAIWSACASAGPLLVSQIANGVYVHVGKHQDFNAQYEGDIANIGFVVGSDCVAIIDTGGSYKIGAALREAVRTVTPLPIRYVINTHWHPDHVFGNAAFNQDQPEFIGHANLPRTLELNRDAMMRSLKQQLGADAERSELVLPTKTVTQEMRLELGGRTLLLQAWPKAHTHTDLTAFDILTQTFWTGDLLFIRRTPSLGGDLKGWIAATERLKSIQAKMTVPGHGSPTDDKNAMLDKQSAYLNLLLKDVRAAIRQGIDLMEAMGSAAQSEKSHWLLFDEVNRRNVNWVYPQLEWE